MQLGDRVVASPRLASTRQAHPLSQCPWLRPHPFSTASFPPWKLVAARHAARYSYAAKGLAPVSSFFKFGSPAPKLPEVVEAGDPVLNEVATPVPVHEITSARIQQIIDDMISVMRTAPAVGIAAPQLGIPLQIIVVEDTKEYISYVQKDETDAQLRVPFELMVICNPVLKKKGNKIARFFEGCLSINGYRGLVERHLEVEVSGFGRDGAPMKMEACGWQARILQHECDHLQGVLYVDKMIPKTFRTTNNCRLPLPEGCPKPGVDLLAPRGSTVS